MRKLVRLSGLIFLSWVLISFVPVRFAVALPSSPSEQAQALGDARLSLMQGDVAIQTEDTGSEWGAAAINTPLISGTKIWDPEKGRSEIQFFGGSSLRASENTEVDITNLSMGSNGDVIQVGVPQGRSYINYAGSDDRDSVFQVDTPVTSIMAYEPSKFQVDTDSDGTTEVSVHRGSVYVQGQNGETQVGAGTMLSIDSNQNAELSAMRPEDSWVSWNLSRDSLLARAGESRRYLPASLGFNSNDLDVHGRWMNTADYGYVWTPVGMVADWAPYRVGRWCWIGGDYVWVSYEPWGWVPYHYGRWAFIRETGWCWVPPPSTAVYWGPGFVAWIHTPTYVSWVPLAPREIYYGHGYYGPHSVNITNVNINRINITNVHVNAKVVNAVTVVNRRTFITGRAERVMDAPKNPFTAGVKPSIGRPDIKPDRATAFPNPTRVVAEKKLPSREIVTRAEKIRNRPVAVHNDISVFKPGERATSMRVNRIERPKPITSVQKPEPGKSPVQRGDAGKAPAERKEVSPPPAPSEQPGGPSTQREFGVAPQHQGPSSPSPAQRKELRPSGQMSKPTPPMQKKETITPSPQKGQTAGTSAPSTHREFGVAPQHQGLSSPSPAQKKELNSPGQMRMPTPSASRPQPTPPAQITRPVPPAPKGPAGPSVQRNMGVAPPHVGQPPAPPAQRKALSSPGQVRMPTPSASRPQPTPPAQITRPVPPAPKGPAGPSVQRNMGVAPPHVGQPSAPPAPGQPKGVAPGTPPRDVKSKDKR